MKPIEVWLLEYEETHCNRTNKIIHYICVPLIYFTILGMLAVILLPIWLLDILPVTSHLYMNLSVFLSIFVLIYYIFLSWKFAVGLAIWTLFCLIVIHQLLLRGLPVFSISFGLFIIAWIFQFIGHKIEGKKPSFLTDIQFLMIGPVWIISHIYDILKINYTK